MRPFAMSRRRIVAATAGVAGLAIAGLAAAVSLPQAGAEEAGIAQPDWSDEADGFAEGTTGGAGGETVTVDTFDELNEYVEADEPYVIRVEGRIQVEPHGYEMRVASDKTIVGVGTDGHIDGGGFFLGEGTSNVIIRNLTISGTYDPNDPDGKENDFDAIQMDTADHVWIDHNHLTQMGDGLIDSRKDTTNLTVSWNVFSDHNKTFGIGWTENVTSQITIHHNWFLDTHQRNPVVDNVANAHLYNNYLKDTTGYGNHSRGSTHMVIENSFYEDVVDPYYLDSTAELRESGSICESCSGRQETGGSAFDPSEFYDYTLDAAEDVPELLNEYAGPQPDIGV